MTLRSVTLSTSAEILLVPTVCAALAFAAEKAQPDANAMASLKCARQAFAAS
jgi:hypothetical protein